MLSQPAAVVEIGASHVTFALFRRGDRGRMKLSDLVREEIPGDTIFEPSWRESVAGALQKLRARTGYTGRVTLILPPHLTLTKFIRVPRVESAKRERLVQFEVQQAMPLALGDLVWDSAVAGEAGDETEIMVAAVKRENIETLCVVLDAVDWTPRRVLPAMAALLGGFRLVQPREPVSTLLFDVGARSGILLLVESRRFCGRSFPLGGPAAVDALTTEMLALRLKQEAARSLAYFGRPPGQPNAARIVLTGGGAQVAGLAGVMTEKFKLPVERLDMRTLLQTEAVTTLQATGFAQLTGAAAVELVRGQPAVDLRPAELRQREAGRSRQRWVVAAETVLAVTLLFPVFHYRRLAAATAQQTTAIEREIESLRRVDAIHRANLAKLEETRNELAELRLWQQRRVAWIALMSDWQQKLAEIEDVWLDQVRFVPSTTVKAGPLRLAVSGRMLDRAGDGANADGDINRRMQRLLAGFARSPSVASVESEHFDRSHPGLLGFDFILAAKSDAPL